MNTDQREIRRKLRILEHAQQCGNIGKTCRFTVMEHLMHDELTMRLTIWCNAFISAIRTVEEFVFNIVFPEWGPTSVAFPVRADRVEVIDTHTPMK